MDPLAELSGSDEDDSSESDAEQLEQQAGGTGGSGNAAAAAAAEAPAAKRQKQQIDLDMLKAHGYQGGPSVLFVPDKHEDGQQNWAW